jgi:hypothetical protein
MTITTITINSVNYVSYASVAETDDYIAVDPTRNTAWDLLTTDEKGSNLVAATNRLDLLTWSGEKEDPAQLNQWPRDGSDCEGTTFPDAEVPVGVQNGCSVLAGSITLDSDFANAGTSGTNTKRVKAGSASVEFFKSSRGNPIQDDTVWQLVNCFTSSVSNTNSVIGSQSFGTESESGTPLFDDYGRTEGFS